MTWIRTVPAGEATGRLAKTYRAAEGRAGRVYGILRTMSLAPAVLDASMALYQRVMFAPEGTGGVGGLSRRQRELLAVVVSRANDCHY
mgnify:CR=1 FL=1